MGFLISFAAAILVVLLLRFLFRRLRLPGPLWAGRKGFRRRRVCRPPSVDPSSFPARKPDWVASAMLALHERWGWSHRKLAMAFNQRYGAATGVTVGRTWVRELLKRQAYEAQRLRRELRHRVPPPLPRNAVWGIDTTFVGDGGGRNREVLGAVDSGSRLSVVLRCLRRLNGWTFLGCLFLAIGEFGTHYGHPRWERQQSCSLHSGTSRGRSRRTTIRCSAAGGWRGCCAGRGFGSGFRSRLRLGRTGGSSGSSGR